MIRDDLQNTSSTKSRKRLRSRVPAANLRLEQRLTKVAADLTREATQIIQRRPNPLDWLDRGGKPKGHRIFHSSTTIVSTSDCERETRSGRAIDARWANAYVAPVMSNLEILTIPDPVLRQKSAPVEAVTDATRRFMDQLLATMYEAPGIGLAAIQVGEKLRIITIDVAREEEPRSPLFLINPEILWSSEDERSTYEEGCLSIPDYYAEVERPAKVRVRYVDYEGEQQEREVEGLLATCVQHEVDHLNGVLFIDYLSKLKRDLVVKKFTKAAREKERQRQHRI